MVEAASRLSRRFQCKSEEILFCLEFFSSSIKTNILFFSFFKTNKSIFSEKLWAFQWEVTWSGWWSAEGEPPLLLVNNFLNDQNNDMNNHVYIEKWAEEEEDKEEEEVK